MYQKNHLIKNKKNIKYSDFVKFFSWPPSFYGCKEEDLNSHIDVDVCPSEFIDIHSIDADLGLSSHEENLKKYFELIMHSRNNEYIRLICSKYFYIKSENFYDFSSSGQSLEMIKTILNKNDNLLIFKPYICIKRISIYPLFICKYNGDIYIIDGDDKNKIWFFSLVFRDYGEIKISKYCYIDKKNTLMEIDFFSYPNEKVNLQEIIKVMSLERDSEINIDINKCLEHANKYINFPIKIDSLIWKILLEKHYQINGWISGSMFRVSTILKNLWKLSTDLERENYIKKVSNIYSYIGIGDYNSNIFISNQTTSKFNDLEKKKFKVFYDFETASVIEEIFIYKPWEKIVLQTSAIIIKDNGKIEKKNLIIGNEKWDPIFFIKKIVDLIYIDDQSVNYIVYNQAFEKSAWKIMLSKIEESNSIDKSLYIKKIQIIMENHFDLMIFFKVTKSNFYIVIKELYGYCSIKKIIEYIPEHILKKREILNYSCLDVKEGMSASHLLSLRICSKLTNSEWKKYKNQLIIYCENDVKSMIGIYDWIKELIRQ